MKQHNLPELFPVSSGWLAKQLATTKEVLADIEYQLRDDNVNNLIEMPTKSGSSSPQHQMSLTVLHNLEHFDRDLKLLEIVRKYQIIVATILQGPLENDTPLNVTTELVQEIGILLLYHEPPQQITLRTNSLYCMFYRYVLEVFSSIYKKSHTKVILNLRHLIRKSGYPSAKGCEQIKSSLRQLQQPESISYFDSDRITNDDVACHVWYLCVLQVTNDTVCKHIEDSICYTAGREFKHRLSSLIDEFSRPIIERVLYHFLPTNANNHEDRLLPQKDTQDQSGTTSSTSSHLDQLPCLLFDYIRTILDGNGVWVTVKDYIQPVFHDVALNIKKAVHDHTQSRASHFSIDKQALLQDIDVYFWKSICRLVEYIFSKRKFFSHPSIIGVKDEGDNQLVSPLPLCNAIEQILRFDEYVSNLSHTNSTSIIREEYSFHSLASTLLASDSSLFIWWVTAEKTLAFSLLDEIFLVEAKREKMINTGRTLETSLLPQTETFISIFHSIERKTSFLSQKKNQAEFHLTIVVPLCMKYMDLMHNKATKLRGIINNKFKVDETELTFISRLWIRITSGMFVVGFIIQQKQKISDINSDSNQDLERIRKSFIQLGDAMVGDFLDLFAELISKDTLTSLMIWIAETGHPIVIKFWKRALYSTDLYEFLT